MKNKQKERKKEVQNIYNWTENKQIITCVFGVVRIMKMSAAFAIIEMQVTG